AKKSFLPIGRTSTLFGSVAQTHFWQSNQPKEDWMRRTLLAIFAFLAVAAFATAQRVDDVNGKHTQLFPDKDHAQGWARPGGGPNQNLIDHGGAVIPSAHVVAIFWGPSWASGGTDNAKATELTNFFGQYGTTPEYNVITQYRVGLSGLGPTAWYDSSTPP